MNTYISRSLLLKKVGNFVGQLDRQDHEQTERQSKQAILQDNLNLKTVFSVTKVSLPLSILLHNEFKSF